ncbi:hypothetical protein DRQ09_04495 [candidate division KSB1 bacterium]|nr:MAG: hypothetical protein DRQ09_04495 [candidate division KSB1 bacterium]
MYQSIVFAQLPSIEQGRLIRVTSTRYLNSPMIGKIKKISSDSLLFFVGNRLFVLPANEIQKIEVKVKQKRHTTEGFILGAVPGAFLLGTYFYNEEKNAKGAGKIGQPGAEGGIVMGLLSGGIIGGLIGHSVITAIWQEIFPENRVRAVVQGVKSPGLACAMSLMLPGLGQYYNGDTEKGIMQEILFFGGIVVAIMGTDDNSTQELIGGALAYGSYIWSVIDAPLSARRKNKLLKQHNYKNLPNSEKKQIKFGLNISYKRSALWFEFSYHF